MRCACVLVLAVLPLSASESSAHTYPHGDDRLRVVTQRPSASAWKRTQCALLSLSLFLPCDSLSLSL